MKKIRITAIISAFAITASLIFMAGCSDRSAPGTGDTTGSDDTGTVSTGTATGTRTETVTSSTGETGETGVKKEISVSSKETGISYDIIANPDYDYEITEPQAGVKISSASDEDFLEIRFIENVKNAEALAPSFLDNYIDYTDIEFSGVNDISGTSLKGETIVAKNGEVQIEAYLVDMDGGVLSIVMCYTLENQSEQTARLYEMLGTLEMK